MGQGEHVAQDYALLGLSLKAHPVSFVRNRLSPKGVVENRQLPELPDGSWVRIAGLILVRQRPGTASGICFLTLEDETGIANVVVFKKLFDQYRRQIVGSKLLTIEGKIQKEGQVIHVIMYRCYDETELLKELGRDDEVKEPIVATKSKKKVGVQMEIFPKGRNFH